MLSPDGNVYLFNDNENPMVIRTEINAMQCLAHVGNAALVKPQTICNTQTM